jgi:hypothetical protein
MYAGYYTEIYLNISPNKMGKDTAIRQNKEPTRYNTYEVYNMPIIGSTIY